MTVNKVTKSLSTHQSKIESEKPIKTGKQNPDIPSVSSERPSHIPRQKIEKVGLVDQPIKVDKVQIEAEIEALEQLSDKVPPSIKKACRHKLKEDLKHLVEKKGKAEEKEETFKSVLGAATNPLEFVHNAFNEPFSIVSEVIEVPFEKQINKVVTPLEWVRTAGQGVATIGSGVSLIIQGVMYKEASKLLKEKEKAYLKSPSEELKIEINTLKKYMRLQGADIKDRLVDFSASFATVSLKSLNHAGNLIKAVAPKIAKSIGWAVSLLDVVWDAISVWRAKKAKTKGELWIHSFAKDHRNVEDAKALLVRRQERLITQKLNKLDINTLREQLNQAGVPLKNSIQTIADVKAELKDELFRNQLSKAILTPEDEHQDTMSVLTRNGLQALAQTKALTEQKFLQSNLIKSSVGLSLTTIGVVAAIVLEVLTIVGIISLTAGMIAFPHLAILVLGIGLGIAGLIYFYKKRPNIAKCFFQGVQLRLGMFSLMAKIRQLQLQRSQAKLEKLENNQARYEQLSGLLNKQDLLNASTYSEDVQKLLKKLQKETAEKVDHFERMGLNEQVKEMKEVLLKKQLKTIDDLADVRVDYLEKVDKNEYWVGEEGVITKLETRLRKAGNKDFAQTTRLIETAKKERISIPNLLAQGLVEDKNELDEETLYILKERMGIDINALKAQDGFNKAHVKKLIADFFKMNEDEMLTFINHQMDDLEKVD